MNTMQVLCLVVQQFDIVFMDYANSDQRKVKLFLFTCHSMFKLWRIYNSLPCCRVHDDTGHKEAGWVEKLTEPPLLIGPTWMEWGQRVPNSKPDGPEYSFIQHIKALNAFGYEASHLRNGVVD